jgi:hypothetical protein
MPRELDNYYDSDFKEFDHELRDFTENVLPETANQVKRVIALQLLTDIVLLTRVDTGRARGGWLVTLGEATDRVAKRLDKSGNQAISVGENIIAKVEDGQDIWLSNNVVYAKYLNDGTEHTTGDFMVERALVKASAQFQ